MDPRSKIQDPKSKIQNPKSHVANSTSSESSYVSYLNFTLPSRRGEGFSLNLRFTPRLCDSETIVSNRKQLHLRRCRASSADGAEASIKAQTKASMLAPAKIRNNNCSPAQSFSLNISWLENIKAKTPCQFLCYHRRMYAENSAVNAHQTGFLNAVEILFKRLQ